MAIVKNINPNETNLAVPVRFICPICKTSKELKMSKNIVEKTEQLITVSIPKYKICDHHFQAFVDKHFKVRGYQRVDFEFSYYENKPDYYIENQKKEKVMLERREAAPEKQEMTLEEIYEEFWEFIDEDNPEFREFVINDKRRGKK